MTTFLRVLSDEDKAAQLQKSSTAFREDTNDHRVFEVSPESFTAVPGAPFSYWVSEDIRQQFRRHPPFLSEWRWPSIGASTKDDFRYLRAVWEVLPDQVAILRQETRMRKWVSFAKGGIYSKYYAFIPLVVNWLSDGLELKADIAEYRGARGWGYQWSAALNGHDYYFRPGLTWPRRTNGLSFRVLPMGCIFADKGPAAFVNGDQPDDLLALCAIMNSTPFNLLVSVQLARTELAQSFEIGIIQQTPIPEFQSNQRERLAHLALRAWSKKRQLNTVDEVSHVFILPGALRPRLGVFDPLLIEGELAEIQTEIDRTAFDLYGFSDADRAAAMGSVGIADVNAEDGAEDSDDGEDDDSVETIDQTHGLLSWTVGVAFGRFDWRFATGEREVPPEPNPFDPLPAKSPGMLPDGATPFHDHSGILVDDQGHPHDLPRLIEGVLARVQADVPGDVRRWLQRDFFPLHLKQYSKSRRKAPIYWPLSTGSGSYTLWLYYPSLTNQTLYTAVNDFLDPKLKQVSRDTATLRDRGAARSREDEKALEALQTLELELIELRDTLLQIAPTYRPMQDDGVQITAAPLWQLFRHKPWQKILQDTWAKLKKGDYDWAHLASAYWPERVREKCRTDKSLAIAHDLEHLYEPPEPKAAKPRGRKKADDA